MCDRYHEHRRRHESIAMKDNPIQHSSPTNSTLLMLDMGASKKEERTTETAEMKR